MVTRHGSPAEWVSWIGLVLGTGIFIASFTVGASTAYWSGIVGLLVVALAVYVKYRSPDRTFTVHAVQKDTFYSNYGLQNPQNTMYVLEEDLADVKEAAGQRLDDDVDTSVLEPLTIRANEGELVEIEFHNDLDRHASMHLTGLPYDVETSDGMNVGQNPDTTVAPGETTTYRWLASEQGSYFIVDGVNQSTFSGDENLPGRGLFGALVVEPPGATWSDPETGDSLRSGTSAIIHDPTGPDHREFAVFYHNVEGAEPPDEASEQMSPV